jgi:hypothetical protein
MSASVELDYTRALQRRIIWDETRTRAASLLATGHNKQHVANEVGVSRATIYNWLDDPEFAGEVDRLSIMMDVSSRAERLRCAMRVLRSMMDEDEVLRTTKDALDWLKFAQSETDGAKIDLSKLAEMLAGESAQQSNGPGGPVLSPPALSAGAIEVEAVGNSEPDDTLNPS